MLLLGANSILPGWGVLPVAGATMVVIAAHILNLHQTPMPPRRRRIRTVNGLLMMFVSALLAYAIGIAHGVEHPSASPSQTREFLVVWLLIIGLVGIIVIMAGLDAATTMRHSLARRAAMRRDMRNKLGTEIENWQSASMGKSTNDGARDDGRNG